MASRIFRFLVFRPYAASLSVDFHSISCPFRVMRSTVSDLSMSMILHNLWFSFIRNAQTINATNTVASANVAAAPAANGVPNLYRDLQSTLDFQLQCKDSNDNQESTQTSRLSGIRVCGGPGAGAGSGAIANSGPGASSVLPGQASLPGISSYGLANSSRRPGAVCGVNTTSTVQNTLLYRSRFQTTGTNADPMTTTNATGTAKDSARPLATLEDHLLLLEMPASWTLPIILTQEQYQRRYSDAGHKVTYFKRAKLERFAAYSQPGGLVERLTLFHDIELSQPLEVCFIAELYP
ncbi:unnamed protein product [Protopolystoma xenopodis]|uniref:Dynein regulatory complex subunit 7 MORN domain-containing protein n=1 Tax=Protopolystoma xenopodis TaxID=117903 RepID=A0A3S5A239_9PLAT|nr:unnamed protein product [Protopolystoma xenopodis]